MVSLSTKKVKKTADPPPPHTVECKVEVHRSQNQGNSMKERKEFEHCLKFDAIKSVKDLVKDSGEVETEVKISKVKRNLQIESFENCFGPYIKPP